MRIALLLAVATAACCAGFSSLRVMPGGRESAMGNAGVASAFGPQAMVWNPAAADVGGFSIRAGYAHWLLDTRQQSLFVVRDARFLRVGIGVVSFTAGAFEYREDVPTEDPLGIFQPVEIAGHLNLARSFGPRVDAGLSGRLYYTKVREEEALVPGLDIGVRVRPLAGLTIGASVVDFARTAAYRREVFRLPVRARLGGAYRRELGGGFEANAALDGSWFFYEKQPAVMAGFECGWGGLAFLRAGYEWLGAVSRPSAGLGLRSAGFDVDYSLTLLNDGFGPAHRISLAYGR